MDSSILVNDQMEFLELITLDLAYFGEGRMLLATYQYALVNSGRPAWEVSLNRGNVSNLPNPVLRP